MNVPHVPFPKGRGTLGVVGDIDNSVRLGGEDMGLGYGGHGGLM